MGTMDLSNLVVGSPIWVQYKVFTTSETGKLQWYKGRLMQVSITEEDVSSIKVKFEETTEFDSICEEYEVKNDTELVQGNQVYPYKLYEKRSINESTRTITKQQVNEQSRDLNKDSDENIPQDPSDQREIHRELNTEIDSGNSKPVRINKATGESTVIDFVSMERRLRVVEAVLRVRRNQVFFNVCGVLNSSLQRFKKRIKRPSDKECDLNQFNWNVTMDCSYEDFKSLASHIKGSLHELCDVTPLVRDRVASENVITISSFRDLCKYFGISEVNYEQLLSIKRVDRHKQLTALKAVGCFIQPNNPSIPTLFCLGGDVSKWNEELKFFSREHGHKTPNGIRTAPFNRLTSSEEHNHILSKFDVVVPQPYKISWTIHDTGFLCAVTEPHSMVMGKLVITIPFTVFNDMTAARRVDTSINRNHDDIDSDSSSSQ